MSLLADLLSKVKHQHTKSDIPPNLKDIVLQQSAHKRKLILISAFVGVAVISGILTVSLMKSFIAISDKKALTVHKSAEVTAKTDTPLQPLKDIEQPKIQPQAATEKEAKKDKTISTEAVQAKPKISTSTSRKILAKKQEKLTASDDIPQPKKPDIEDAAKKEAASEPHPDYIGTKIKGEKASQRDSYLYTAREYELKKDYPNALSYYKKALDIDKNNFTVMNNVAYILLHLGLTSESIKYSQMSMEIKKDYAPALINLGIAYARAENIPAAKTYFSKALTVEPDNQFAILNLAVLYERQNDYQKASEYFQKLSRLGNITGFLGLARVYEKQDQAEEAIKIYRNISAFNSIDAETRKMAEQRINLLSEGLKDKK